MHPAVFNGLPRSGKPLKRFIMSRRLSHRAEATVLMKNASMRRSLLALISRRSKCMVKRRYATLSDTPEKRGFSEIKPSLANGSFSNQPVLFKEPAPLSHEFENCQMQAGSAGLRPGSKIVGGDG